MLISWLRSRTPEHGKSIWNRPHVHSMQQIHCKQQPSKAEPGVAQRSAKRQHKRSPTSTYNGDWDAGLEPLQEGDVLARTLRQRGGHNVGGRANQGAVAAEAGAKVDGPGQDLHSG